MENHFLNFLNSLKNSKNKNLLESLESGLGAMLECYRVGGYQSDVERVSTIDRMNGEVANISSAAGSDLLNILIQNENKLKGRYSYDPNPELDGLPTSQFIKDLVKEKYPTRPKEYTDDDLGFGLNDV